ncbi:MAG: alanine:cation symporter family protein, partial [Alistipes sp.]|nr:alanine:cation symporter family protein [Alistipes sp.]
FWLWVSAVVGMGTKFFEGTLALMYRGRDSRGELQGGPMYMITEGLGRKWRPLAIFFSVMGLIGTLCLYQSNQLVESIDTVFFASSGLSMTLFERLIAGVAITAVVAVVILGGIRRIARIATRLVPAMITAYFLLVLYIVATHLPEVPAVFGAIFREAFSLKAGIGGMLGVALIGARRAASVNEAGIGTASMMHGASKNSEPVREGFVAMLGPLLDSGIVCTLTAIAILLTGDYDVEGVKGLQIALNAFDSAMPGIGGYLLFAIVVVFAFSTMFSYSYYGTKCASYLFGADRARYYNWFFLAMLIVAAVIPLHTVVGIIDMAYALMAIPTMFTLIRLAPRAKRALRSMS